MKRLRGPERADRNRPDGQGTSQRPENQWLLLRCPAPARVQDSAVVSGKRTVLPAYLRREETLEQTWNDGTERISRQSEPHRGMSGSFQRTTGELSLRTGAIPGRMPGFGCGGIPAFLPKGRFQAWGPEAGDSSAPLPSPADPVEVRPSLSGTGLPGGFVQRNAGEYRHLRSQADPKPVGHSSVRWTQTRVVMKKVSPELVADLTRRPAASGEIRVNKSKPLLTQSRERETVCRDGPFSGSTGRRRGTTVQCLRFMALSGIRGTAHSE